MPRRDTLFDRTPLCQTLPHPNAVLSKNAVSCNAFDQCIQYTIKILSVQGKFSDTGDFLTVGK